MAMNGDSALKVLNTETGREHWHTERLNMTGSMASLLCAIHCALMSALTLIRLGSLATENVMALSGALGVWSLRRGFREHGQQGALLTLAFDLAMLLLGRDSKVR